MNDSPSIWCINTLGETGPGLCYLSLRRWYGRFLSQLVAVWWGIITQSQNWSKNKASRKPPFLMGKDMVSCAFYLSQIHWSSQAFPPSMFVATAGWTDPSLGEIYGWTPTSCKTFFGFLYFLQSIHWNLLWILSPDPVVPSVFSFTEKPCSGSRGAAEI